MYKHVIIAIAVALSGCAGVKVEQAPLEVVPGGCRGVEIRPSLLSTGLVIVCWNEQGQVVASSGTAGTAAIDIPLDVLRAGATVGGAAVLGHYIKEAAGAVPNDFDVDIDDNGMTDGINDLSGEVEDVIDRAEEALD